MPTVPVAVCQNGFMDYSIHPLEPLALRLTLAGPIEAVDIPAMASELKHAILAHQPPAQNWNVFVEYRHSSFGTSVISLPLSQLTTNSTINLDGLEFGMNYKFT